MSQVIEVDEYIATLFDIKRLILNAERYLQITNKYNNFQYRIELLNNISRKFEFIFDVFDDYFKKVSCKSVSQFEELVADLKYITKQISHGEFPERIVNECKECLFEFEQTQLDMLKLHYNNILNYLQSEEFYPDIIEYRKQLRLNPSAKLDHSKWTKYMDTFRFPHELSNKLICNQRLVLDLEFLYELINDYKLKNWIVGYRHLANDFNQMQLQHISLSEKYKFILRVNNNIYDPNMSIVDIINEKYNILEQITLTIEELQK